MFCFSGLCSFIFTELNGIRGQDLDLLRVHTTAGGWGRAVNLDPQAQGSISFALFSPLPFLPGSAEATGLLVGRVACASSLLTMGEGKGEALS